MHEQLLFDTSENWSLDTTKRSTKKAQKVISIQDQKSQDREHHLGPGMQNSTLQKTVLV